MTIGKIRYKEINIKWYCKNKLFLAQNYFVLLQLGIKQKGTLKTAQSFNEKGKSVFHQRKHIFLLDDVEIACNISKLAFFTI